MSDWLNAAILGVVEGLTEFLPVSSTAHLLLTEKLLGLSGPQWAAFTVLIQLGAILAVVALYFERLWKVLVTLPSDPQSRRFALSVLVAFLPAVVLGVLLHDFIKQVLFESPRVICISLILGGIVLAAVDRWRLTPKFHDATKYPLVTSLGIGLFQCLAMIPGTSRSGSSIVGAMLMGADKRSAAEFSFFLAIPTMAGAFAYDLYKNRAGIDMHTGELVAVGFVVSFISGLVVIKAMLGFVQKRGYWPFSVWRIVVGVAGLLFIAH
jgi:undecaprenyl-diphosphatase